MFELSPERLVQRYSQSSVLKRTALELVAEDMLSHAIQGAAEEAVGSVAMTDGQESSDESWGAGIGSLFDRVHFGASDHVSRHQLGCALQSLGKASVPCLCVFPLFSSKHSS